MSISDASTECAIPLYMIEALEKGQTDRLPPECFALGFLRSYCRYLGVESEGYLAALKAALTSADPKTEAKRPMRIGFRLRLPSLSIELPHEIRTWLSISAILLLGWVGYSIVVEPNATSHETQALAATADLRLPDSPNGR